MVDPNNPYNSYFVGSLITSVVGALLLLFTDFAAWEHYDYYHGIFSAGWVSGEAIPYLIVITFVSACLFFCAYISFMGLQSPSKVNRSLIKRGLLVALTAFVVVFISALLFVMIILSDEPDYWWFGPGFYGSIIGSGLSALIFYTVHVNYVDNTSSSAKPAPFIETLQTIDWKKVALWAVAIVVILFLVVFFTSEAFFELLEGENIFDVLRI